MIYSKLYLQKKSPSFPIFVIWGVCMISLFLFIKSGKSSTQVPVVRENPKRYEIVNMTSNQIGIFWETKNEEDGWVRYGENDAKLDKIAYDDRDLAPVAKPYTLHYVTLKNLKSNTDYYYQMVSSRGAYADSRSKPFFVRTPLNSIQKYSHKPAYGKAILANGVPARNIFVMVKIEDKRPLLALTKETGEWLIPLHILVDRMSGKIVQDISDQLKVEVEYLGESKKDSFVTSTIAGIAPMQQTVILGKNYSLLANGEVLSAVNDRDKGSKQSFFVSYPIENGIVPAARPLINGGGIPGNDVFVFINSKPQYAFRTTVDKNGKWRVLPDIPMDAGAYIASITSKGEKNGKITVRRNFFIAKSGEQVLGVATGEPTLAPTSMIFPTASPTTAQATASTVTPTPASMISPTNVITYPTSQLTPQAPQTGGSPLTLIFSSLSLIIIGAGLMLVF